jgi:hypothetical protein
MKLPPPHYSAIAIGILSAGIFWILGAGKWEIIAALAGGFGYALLYWFIREAN